MRALVAHLVSGLFLLFALAACDSAASRVVGKWQTEGSATPVIWEFSNNGTATTASGPGKYSFGDSKRMKVQTQFATFIYSVEMDGDKMKLTDASGSVTQLKRVP
jgi:hypothetical protein